MWSGVLDLSHVDGSGSPVSTKFSVSFHGYGGSAVIEVPEIEMPEIEVPEIEVPEIEVPEIEVPEIGVPEILPWGIVPDGDSPSLQDELEFLQPAGLGRPELPVQGCPGRR